MERRRKTYLGDILYDLQPEPFAVYAILLFEGMEKANERKCKRSCHSDYFRVCQQFYLTRPSPRYLESVGSARVRLASPATPPVCLPLCCSQTFLFFIFSSTVHEKQHPVDNHIYIFPYICTHTHTHSLTHLLTHSPTHIYTSRLVHIPRFNFIHNILYLHAHTRSHIYIIIIHTIHPMHMHAMQIRS